MATTELVSNSDRAKEKQLPEKHVEKVVKGQARTRKKSVGNRLADTFVSEEAGNVKNYILFDVLIPALKDTFSDMVNNGLNMILFGTTSGRGHSGRSSSIRRGESRTSYTRYYEDKDRRDERRYDTPVRRGYDFDDVIVDTRGEAEDILSNMVEIIDKYNFVSIADLYEMAGVRAEYTDNKYGWDDLSTASVVRERDGYRIKLPRPKPY